MNWYKDLKRVRVLIAIIVLIATLALFIDIYEWIPSKQFKTILFLQFIPSLLNFIQVLSIITAGGFLLVLLLTFFTGRLYCSIICPLGILQDIINRFAKWVAKKKRFFKFRKSQKILRYSVLTIMSVSIITGAGFIVSWLDPYSLFGRFFTYVKKPAIIFFNNILTEGLIKIDNYTLYQQVSPMPSIMPTIISFIIIVIIGFMAWKRGRLFCNTICPVGTLLGEISKYSLLKINFDKNACTKCGKCAGICKSECIDIKNQTVDYSRCVMCFDCLAICPESALLLRKPPNKIKPSEAKTEITEANGKNRRKLLVTGATLLVGNHIIAQQQRRRRAHGRNGYHKLKENLKKHPVAPPGSVSIEHFNDICTACSLCISACPTHVLQPALTEYGLMGFMQPHMDYLTHYCNFDCTKCGEVCPTGAIQPLTIEEKHVTQIGKAVFIKHNCVVHTNGTDCGACSEHCPTKAVKMIQFRRNLLIPEVDQSICIGCGACEYACPVEAPFKAIYVNGNAIHQNAEKPQKQIKEKIEQTEDFPF